MSDVIDLREMVRTVFAEGGYGMTLRTGQRPVAHTSEGPQTGSENYLTTDDLVCLLEHLIGTRERREFRARGSVRFMGTLDQVRIVGGARMRLGEIQVELRRMAEAE